MRTFHIGIADETKNDILKRIRDYCKNTVCESCPFLEFKEKAPPGMSHLNSFCEFGLEALHPLLPYQWPVEAWIKDTEISERNKPEDGDMILL